MTERYKPLPIENSLVLLAIPSEAVPLNEMVKAIVMEEEMLKPVKQPLKTALREARLVKGLTLKQLGGMSGIGHQTVGLFETLKQLPSNKQAAAIAQVLETDKSQLFPPYLREFVKSRGVSAERQFETVPLDEVPENEIEQVITRRVGRTDFFDKDAAEPAMETFLQEAVKDACMVLTSKQRRIIEFRFAPAYKRKLTLKELGVMFGRTPEAVRGHEERALEKLKKDKTLRAFYGTENKDAHKAKEALMNGVINAIHQKDFVRAQDNLEKIEKQEMILAGLDRSSKEKEIVEEIGRYPFSYRWSEETISRFIRWLNDSKGHLTIDMERIIKILRVVAALREVWRLKAQIHVESNSSK